MPPPKDAAALKLYNELIAHKKNVDSANSSIATDLKTLKDACASKTATADSVTKASEEAGKGLTGYDKTLTEAKKKQADGDKSKDAEVKKQSGELKASIAKGDAAVKELRGQIEMGKKIATKGASDDAALTTSLSKVLETGNALSEEFGNWAIMIPGEISNLDDQYKALNGKPTLPAVMKPLVANLSKRAAEVGPKITTATSVSASLASEAKKGASAYDAALKDMVKKANDLKTKLDGQTTQIRTMHANLLKAVTKYTPYTK